MEKRKNTPSGIVLSKVAEQGKEKIIFKFTANETVKNIFCFILQFSQVFSGMSPFGIAFYSSVFRPDRWILYFISSLLGMVVAHGEIVWIYSVTLIAQTAIFAVFDGYLSSGTMKSVLSGALFFILSLTRFIGTQYLIYDLFALILETIILGVSSYVFFTAVQLTENFRKRTFISERENMCIYSALSILMLSLSALSPDPKLRISSIISVFLLLCTSLSAPRKSALTMAILFGVIGSLSPDSSVAIMGTYPFAVLLASSLKDYGKIGIILGFVIANTTSSLFLSDTGETVIAIYDCFIASFLFSLMPQKLFSPLKSFFEKTDNSANAYYKVQSPDEDNLKRISDIADSISDLSDIYVKTCHDKKLGNSYLMFMMKRVGDKVCRGCPSKNKCFNLQTGKAYEVMRSFLENNSYQTVITAEKLPDKFKSICHRCDSFAEALNHCSDIIKTEIKWLSKTNETRKLISVQLSEISQILKKECNNAENSRDRELEEKLRLSLDRSGIYPANITVRKNNELNYDICVSVKDKTVDKTTRPTIKTCIESTTHSPIAFSGAKRLKDEYVFCFCPSTAYSASFGYATKSKSGEKVCGDSFNVIYTGKNKMVMVLSDGMGSGKGAHEESKMTVSLLEKFLSTGFDCDTAVELINSSLLMNGNKESFATMDICDINLSAASMNFTKLGAADAYIKSGDSITQIKGKSLPIGILKDTGAQKHMLSIDSDTVVVMMSDGVADLALKNEAPEGWIEGELKKMNITNPQIMAGKLLERAVQYSKNDIHDDMTVLVAYIARTDEK
ncbi:MAG: SpoIIE family protein phosphatase [Clostridia bacterium]|nr:SpoIIE family protein phosphatase [Clostridia bacterium]